LVFAVRTTYLPSVRADAAPPITLSAEQVQSDVPADQVWKIVTSDNPAQRLVVTRQFAALDNLPDGSVIAVFAGDVGQPWVVPLYGVHLQRQVETISRVSDPTQLRIEMSAVGAEYVMLGQSSATLTNVRNDPLYFQQVGDQTVNGAVLIQLGYFPDNYCSSAQTRLTWTAQRTGGEFHATVTAHDACGHPVADLPIEFWRGDPAVPLWGGSDALVGLAITDHDGQASFDIVADRGAVRLFARFTGSTRHDPATTTPVVESL
jgi:hypothetical protein